MPKLHKRRASVPTAWKLMLVISILYLLCVWLGYRQVERSLAHKSSSGMVQVFAPKISKNGLQLYSAQCPVAHSKKHGHLSGPVDTTLTKTLSPGMCQANSREIHTDIQVEKEWPSISVFYPQYVYTVSGWIQVIDVPTYTPKPLHVIIVPHSHQDPGWKSTFESYFRMDTKNTLELMLTNLGQNPKWKFIWSEVAFLHRWMEQAGMDKRKLKKLISNGQLEIVTGGWVMTDEAVAHYTAMLDQLMEGHRWLKDNLGVTPNSSWSVDTFGHSPTMTYLLQESGMKHMVIQRAHFAVKRYLAKKKSLEFYWKQAWDSSNTAPPLCHMMPFLLYSIPYSCGPDPHVCCQFDFAKNKCFQGTKTVHTQPVNATNVRKLAWLLWEQLQKKSELYKTNVILMPHGDDFRYTSSNEWTAQFGNLQKLMDYMNQEEDMNIKLEFGTVSDYFRALQADTDASQVALPSLSGDFLPYNDRDDQYWTGFYTSRPLYKHIARRLHAKLRLTEMLFSLLCAVPETRGHCPYLTKQLETLPEARQTLALFQHHDAITGTAKASVVVDYAKKLHRASETLDYQLAQLMFVSLLQEETNTSRAINNVTMTMIDEWASIDKPPTLKAHYHEGKWFVLVSNPLTIPFQSVISVRTSSPASVRGRDGSYVMSQINPVLNNDLRPVLGLYDVLFVASVYPLSVSMYVMLEDMQHSKFSSVTLFGRHSDLSLFVGNFKARASHEETIEIQNKFLKATFSACTGTLQFTHRKLDDIIHRTSVTMVTYGTGSWSNPFRDKSGAYVFMPDGPAQEVESHYPPMVVLQGPIMSTVVTKLPGVVHRATLFDVSGPVAMGVDLTNTVHLTSPLWDNKEIVMRVESDVLSPDTEICVDLNGFQMHRKKWRAKMTIQGNFHPVTSTAYIEDTKSRLTLLTSETHAMASLKPGLLEAVLDRRLMQDDWRGLNEGVTDNVETVSHFVLLLEGRTQPSQAKSAACFPSLLASLVAQHLNNPPQASSVKEDNVPYKYRTSRTFLQEPWPCQHQLLALKREGPSRVDSGHEGLLMVVHRAGVDCGYTEVYTDCKMQKLQWLDKFFGIPIVKVTQMSLTGVTEKEEIKGRSVELKDMEIKTFRIKAAYG